jgi:hypothetical protein
MCATALANRLRASFVEGTRKRSLVHNHEANPRTVSSSAMCAYAYASEDKQAMYNNSRQGVSVGDQTHP